MKDKTIAILTSGGDCPGMNACIRAAVKTSIKNNTRILGIKRGYEGLIEGDAFEIDYESVSDIIYKGGTILLSARSEEFKTKKGLAKAIRVLKEKKIDAIITIGGDGTFRGAKELSENGIPCIGIPGTIDNDIECSEYTIGFDTAVNTSISMIDKIRDTSKSHSRCSLVEVMGRNSGQIAFYTAIASGAIAVALPEIPLDFEKDIKTPIINRKKNGGNNSIIVVAEKSIKIEELAKKIYKEIGIETRYTVLGHVQRGGPPTLKDRIIANEMGQKAVELILNNKSARVLVVKNGKVEDLDIIYALDNKKSYKKIENIKVCLKSLN